MRALALGVLLALAAPAFAQPLEPPPEAPEGVDYTVEPLDSLGEGDVELGMSAAGRSGSAPTRRRRLRFSGDDLSGAVREGSEDPLAGGSIDGRGGLGRFTVGRLAPRWGRGLLLGAAGDPWQREALDRGTRARFRGRAGEGVMLRRGGGDAIEALYGRFSRRRLAGGRIRRGVVTLGTLTDGRATHQASLGLARGAGESELVGDRAGRWRAEALIERPLDRVPGRARAGDGWTASLRARAGAVGFSSLAEGGRPGPAQALASGLQGPVGRLRLSAVGALWRFRPGVAGARAGLAIERPLAHHGTLSLGFEEQRGSRRDAGTAASLASLAARSGGMRQGWWGEWWSGPGERSLGVRHESWGERPWARGVVRSVTSARLEARGPAGVSLGVTHSIYRVKRGESLYLPEAESDRLVLRAVAGEGERTRIEARAPFAGGRLRAALSLGLAAGRRARPQWTLDWTRRARLREGGRCGFRVTTWTWEDGPMRFAQRLNRLGTETAFEVLARAQALEAQGKRVIHLEIGEPDFDTPQYIRRAAAEALEAGFTHYGPSAGLPEFRRLIAEQWGRERNIPCDADNVVVTPGAKPIMFFAMLALLEEGDEVLYPSPGFPIYESVANFLNARTIPLVLREENGFDLDIKDLESKLSSRTRMLVLNSPHNPTGAVLKPETVEAIAALARKHDFHILSDEIYARIQYQGRHLSIASLPGMAERTIVLDGFSKTYAMTGWRLGFGIMEKQLAKHVARLMTNSNSCTATFVQKAGHAALAGSQAEVRAMVEEFRVRRDVIVNGLNTLPGVRCFMPSGAFYAFPNITGTGIKSGELAKLMLEEAGVACLSGTAFGAAGEGYLRFSYANSAENIRTALAWLGEFLSVRAK